MQEGAGPATTMNIVVCVKHVPDATADPRFESDNTVDRVGVDGLLSELDEYAVEQALQIKEKQGEGAEVTVTALCVGPEGAVDAVRKALQMGADSGVHVVDDAIAGSDYFATSLVLAKAIEKVRETDGADLIVCGMASTDAAGSVVPAMLAERLGLPQSRWRPWWSRRATRSASSATTRARPRSSARPCRSCCP